MQNLFNLIKIHQNKNWFCLSGILLISIVTIVFPILLMGFPNGGPDMMQHSKFALVYHDAISNGVFFPSWVPDYIDYGSIGIRFYPPLPYYFLAVSKMVIGNWFDTFWINLFGWMFVGCLGVYLFAKEWMSPTTAMITGIIYACMPYHLLEIFQYFFFAEFVALSILPFCFLFITRICCQQRWDDTFLFTVSYSLLILTHIPLTIIGSISLAFYVIVLIDYQKFIKTLKHLVIATCLSLTATSFYWIKVVTEIQWVAHNNSNYSKGLFGYSEWLFPISISNHENGLIANNAGFFDVLIILNLMLLIPAVIYLIKLKSKNKSERRIILALSATAFFAFFMTSRPSGIVWYFVPFLQKVQFPWRWISVLSLLGILSFMVSIMRLDSLYTNAKRLFIYPILILAVSIMIFNFSQIIGATDPISRTEFEKFIETLPNQRSLEPWWTIWAKSEAFENKDKIAVLDRSFDITEWNLESRKIIISEGDPTNIRVATFYYPYWKAEINGQPTEVNKDENGLIIIEIPSEKSLIHLYLAEPFLNGIALACSVLSWTIFLIAIGIMFFKKSLYENLSLSFKKGFSKK